jgi:hypothetical protein
MRTLTAMLLTTLVSAASAQVEIVPPGGVDVNPYGQGRAFGQADCHELRLACLHKEDLGEQGRGNCQRYREMCRTHHYTTRTPGY